jgi:hypothetical protein
VDLVSRGPGGNELTSGPDKRHLMVPFLIDYFRRWIFRVWQILIFQESRRGSGTLQTLVDSLTPYSCRFLFDFGLGSKKEQEICFYCGENHVWSLYRSITLE